MHSLADVFLRLAQDLLFAGHFRDEPRQALAPYALSPDDIARLAAVLNAHDAAWPDLARLFELDDDLVTAWVTPSAARRRRNSR